MGRLHPIQQRSLPSASPVPPFRRRTRGCGSWFRAPGGFRQRHASRALESAFRRTRRRGRTLDRGDPRWCGKERVRIEVRGITKRTYFYLFIYLLFLFCFVRFYCFI